MTLFFRKYKNYNKYLAHQASKLDMLLEKKNSISNSCVRVSSRPKRARKFQKILKRYRPYMMAAGRVLCLGARNGAEVMAFRKMGFRDAIGIDLNPGRKNKYVVKGDFHDMPFEDNSFSSVFTNSIDHIFDIRKLSKEVSRVLIPKGRLILEISHFVDPDFGDDEIKLVVEDKKLYESFCFDDFKDIEDGFEEFKIVKRFKSYEKLIVVLENKQE